MTTKKNILFIHDAYPNQLSAVHEYFRESKEVNSYLLTQEISRSSQQFRKESLDGVFTFQPDGHLSEQSYYYSGGAERIARGSVNVLSTVQKILENHPLDLIVAHDISGFPYLLYDAVDVPVVSYSEFPDYKQYGWDERYPPMKEQIYATLLTQAYTYQSVVKSKVTIVPSEHARLMYPEPLRSKVVVQMDAFDAQQRRAYDPQQAAFTKEPGITYIGFASNLLSSEKGLEHFIQISQLIAQGSDTIRFVIIGHETAAAGYGYERQYLEGIYGKDQKTFLQYLFEKYRVDRSKYIVTGQLAGEMFSATMHHVDLFLYPLQHGSANWGFFEMLIRGKLIIASDRCFIPEIITDGKNGFIRPLNDHGAWAKLALSIAANIKEYAGIAKNAATSAQAYHVEHVAKRYLDIFEQHVWGKKSAKKK